MRSALHARPGPTRRTDERRPRLGDRLSDRGRPERGPAGDTVWTYGTVAPDIFVDGNGNFYTGIAYGGTYIYRINPTTNVATQALQVQAPAANGFNNYGMAWFDGAIYLGQYDGTLYRVDPATGAAAHPAATIRDDLTGVLTGATYNNDASATASGGGAVPAPTYTAPNLSWTGQVEANANVRLTYTVRVKNPVPADGATLTNAVVTNVPGVCPPGSTDPKCSTVTRVPRLDIVKSATPNPAQVGQPIDRPS